MVERFMSKHRVYLASNYSLNLSFLLSKPYKSQVSHYHRKNRFKSLNLKIQNYLLLYILKYAPPNLPSSCHKYFYMYILEYIINIIMLNKKLLPLAKDFYAWNFNNKFFLVDCWKLERETKIDFES